MGCKSISIERHGKKAQERSWNMKGKQLLIINDEAGALCIFTEEKVFHVGIGKERFQIWRR